MGTKKGFSSVLPLTLVVALLLGSVAFIGTSNIACADPAYVSWSISLETLYEVSLDLYIYSEDYSMLVAKFYTYSGTYQALSIVDYIPLLENFRVNKNVAHPLGLPVEIVELVLVDNIVDNTGEVIMSFTVRRLDLETRFMEIPFYWAIADPAGKLALETEFSSIPFQWSIAPPEGPVPPSAMLHITAKYNGADENSTVTLTIEHMGGDAITVSDIKLIADNSDRTQYEADLEDLTAENLLTVGHSITLDAYFVVGIGAGDTIRVQLIHVPSSQTIFDRSDILIQ